MPEKKRQHYVPKSYMKAFANENKKFAIYNLKEKTAYFPVPYDGQCYSDYFYGTDTQLETKLSLLENKWLTALDNARNRVPLTDEDISGIKEFAVYQKQRTLAESEHATQERIELVIECAKSICANKNIPFGKKEYDFCVEYAKGHSPAPADLLEYVEMIAQLISDLDIVVISYNTKNRLIASDSPVVLLNPFCPRQNGFGCMGIIILFPISPQQLVVIYDSKMYPRFKGQNYISLSNENEVRNLNALQVLSGEKVLFGYEKKDFDAIASNSFEKRETLRSLDKVSSLGPENNKIIITSLRQTAWEYHFSFGKTRTDFDTIPAFCREAPPRKWEAGWENKLRIAGSLVKQISKVDKAPKWSRDYRKEYYEGRRKLLNCSMKYWEK